MATAHPSRGPRQLQVIPGGVRESRQLRAIPHGVEEPPQLRVIPGGLSEPRRLRVVHGGPGGSRRWFRHAYGLLIGYCVAAAATAVAVAGGGTRHPVVALAVLACALLAAGTRMTLPVALASGMIGWLFFDGFVIGRHANLGWDGGREVWWLLVLVAAAGSGCALGRAYRRGNT